MPGILKRRWVESDDESNGDSDYDERDIGGLPPPPPPAILEMDHADRDGQGPRIERGEQVDLMETLNGFQCGLVPERITGMVVRNEEILYVVKWENYGNREFCIESRIMSAHRPNMVIDFHHQFVLQSLRSQN